MYPGEAGFNHFYRTPPVSVHKYNPQQPAAMGSRVQSVLRGNQSCEVSSYSLLSIVLSDR
jgi:hypothetical protein